jgi:hypothetical protein
MESFAMHFSCKVGPRFIEVKRAIGKENIARFDDVPIGKPVAFHMSIHGEHIRTHCLSVN